MKEGESARQSNVIRGRVTLLGSLWSPSGGEGPVQGLHVVTTPLYVTLAYRIPFLFGFFDRGGGSHIFSKAPIPSTAKAESLI
jgi:hypothetical protein